MRRGFTLLELSIVLVIVALLVGAGVSMGGNAIKNAERIKTQERLATIKAALEQYAKINDKLPVPADRSFTPMANPATFGVGVRPFAANFPGLVERNTTVYIGGVPVRDLGLPDAYAADAWGNKFTYSVSIGQVNNYATTDAALRVFNRPSSGSFDVVTSMTDRTIVPSTPGAITSEWGASFVVVSHGPDGRGAFAQNSSAVTTACGAGLQRDTDNCDNNDDGFSQAAYNDGNIAAQYFDDFIVWGSNALDRPRINVAQPACPVGVCEGWCAACTKNFPVLDISITAGGLSGSGVTPTLCKKIITKNSPCEATCVWSGIISDGSVDDGRPMARCP